MLTSSRLYLSRTVCKREACVRLETLIASGTPSKAWGFTVSSSAPLALIKPSQGNRHQSHWPQWQDATRDRQARMARVTRMARIDCCRQKLTRGRHHPTFPKSYNLYRAWVLVGARCLTKCLIRPNQLPSPRPI